MTLVGNLRDLKLVNIIQINCIERNAARVSVKLSEMEGVLYFFEGAIVHAEFGPFVGEQAVYEMLALNEGEFEVEADIETPSRTITHPWNSIVLEGLRLIDEKKVFNNSVTKQLLGVLTGIKNVQNVFVLNYNGQVIEGDFKEDVHPLTLTFIWYKLKKMLNLFYSDTFQYIVLRKPHSSFFIFEYRPNLIIIETDLRVIVSEFTLTVKKVFQEVNEIK